MSASNVKLDSEMYIVNILQQLNCPLVRNAEDWWIQDLLFQPGTHRLQLFDWIISKFGFSEIIECENFKEKNTKDYLKIISAMGLCGKSDINLITGDVTKAKQLSFWKLILDMLLLNSQLDSEGPEMEFPTENAQSNVVDNCKIICSSPITDEETVKFTDSNQTFLSHCKNVEDSVFICSKPKKYLNDEYKKSVRIMNGIATSVPVNDLFLAKVSVLPPDIEKVISYILSANAEDVNKLRNTKDFAITAGELNNQFHSLISTASSSTNEDSVSNHEVSLLKESEKTTVIFEIKAAEKQFTDAYNELKPVLQSSGVVSNNFGPEFEKTYPQMELIAKVMSYLETSKSVKHILDEESSNLQDFEPSSLNLTASELEEYIALLQENVHKMPKSAVPV